MRLTCQWENYRRDISSSGFLPRTTQGRDAIKEADLRNRPIAKTLDWKHQRKMWQKLKSTEASTSIVQ